MASVTLPVSQASPRGGFISQSQGRTVHFVQRREWCTFLTSQHMFDNPALAHTPTYIHRHKHIDIHSARGWDNLRRGWPAGALGGGEGLEKSFLLLITVQTIKSLSFTCCKNVLKRIMALDYNSLFIASGKNTLLDWLISRAKILPPYGFCRIIY